MPELPNTSRLWRPKRTLLAVALAWLIIASVIYYKLYSQTTPFAPQYPHPPRLDQHWHQPLVRVPRPPGSSLFFNYKFDLRNSSRPISKHEGFLQQNVQLSMATIGWDRVHFWSDDDCTKQIASFCIDFPNISAVGASQIAPLPATLLSVGFRKERRGAFR